MSLLEDVFLEDEAGEAQELERVIEGDEYDERPRDLSNSDENSEKDDEAEEDKRRVDPTQEKSKRVVKHPRFILNPARLTGPRGIHIIPEHFKDFKFKGKGHEKEDLDMVLKKLEHWAYRLYPKFQFEDCLKKIETLGKKRPVMVHLHKIRSDQYVSEETVVQQDSSDEEPQPAEPDEFDKLLQQQIELARATPAPSSVRKPTFSTPGIERSYLMPKATSSPSISDEQKERMIRNRQLAEERRLARLQQNSTNDSTSNNDFTEEQLTIINGNIENESTSKSKYNRSNVIDSSDDECDTLPENHSISVDVHIKNAAIIYNKSKERGLGQLQHVNDSKSNNYISEEQPKIINENNESDIKSKIKHNRSNVIERSDEECNMVSENSSVAVNVHIKNASNIDDDSNIEHNSINNVERQNQHSIAENEITIHSSDKNTSNEIRQSINSEILSTETDKNKLNNDSENYSKNKNLVLTKEISTNCSNEENVEKIENIEQESEHNNTQKHDNHEIDVTKSEKSTNRTSNGDDDDEQNNLEDLMDVDFNDDF